MLQFTHSELRDYLLTKGVPSINWHIQDWTLQTIADAYAFQVWEAWIDSLRTNAPQLLTTRVVGGRTKTVPLWIAEAGDCENHALLCFAHATVGNWINAQAGGAKVGRTLGMVFFNAIGNPALGLPSGGHAIIWFVNHDGDFRTFEPAIGEFTEWKPEERASAYFGICA